MSVKEPTIEKKCVKQILILFTARPHIYATRQRAPAKNQTLVVHLLYRKTKDVIFSFSFLLRYDDYVIRENARFDTSK